MKKAIFFISLSILLIIIDIFLIFGNKDTKKQKKEKTNSNYITIIQYEAGKNKIVKELKIENETEIKKLNKLKEEIRVLTEEEKIAILIINEIEIIYDEDTQVNISSSEKGFCNYINKKENISGLSHMPKELYEYVIEKLNIK